MADIYCPICGEPWELDEFHEVEGLSYAQARAAFRKNGCQVFGTSHGDIEPDRAAASAAIMDLSGDDLDGAATTMNDWFGD